MLRIRIPLLEAHHTKLSYFSPNLAEKLNKSKTAPEFENLRERPSLPNDPFQPFSDYFDEENGWPVQRLTHRYFAEAHCPSKRIDLFRNLTPIFRHSKNICIGDYVQGKVPDGFKMSENAKNFYERRKSAEYDYYRITNSKKRQLHRQSELSYPLPLTLHILTDKNTNITYIKKREEYLKLINMSIYVTPFIICKYDDRNPKHVKYLSMFTCFPIIAIKNTSILDENMYGEEWLSNEFVFGIFAFGKILRAVSISGDVGFEKTMNEFVDDFQNSVLPRFDKYREAFNLKDRIRNKIAMKKYRVRNQIIDQICQIGINNKIKPLIEKPFEPTDLTPHKRYIIAELTRILSGIDLLPYFLSEPSEFASIAHDYFEYYTTGSLNEYIKTPTDIYTIFTQIQSVLLDYKFSDYHFTSSTAHVRYISYLRLFSYYLRHEKSPTISALDPLFLVDKKFNNDQFFRQNSDGIFNQVIPKNFTFPGDLYLVGLNLCGNYKRDVLSMLNKDEKWIENNEPISLDGKDCLDYLNDFVNNTNAQFVSKFYLGEFLSFTHANSDVTLSLKFVLLKRLIDGVESTQIIQPHYYRPWGGAPRLNKSRTKFEQKGFGWRLPPKVRNTSPKKKVPTGMGYMP